MNTRLLTVEETAKKLGRTVQAVYRLVERRRILFKKDRKRLLFVEAELEKFIAALPGLSLEDLCESEKTEV